MKLDQPKQPNRRSLATISPEANHTKLCLRILEGPNSETALMTWQDDGGGKLEKQLTEIAVRLVLTAEIKYRERSFRQYQWLVKRKAEFEEEERQREFGAQLAEGNGRSGTSC